MSEPCPVCEAPPLPVQGACVFCRAPLTDTEDATGLLDYMAGRLPGWTKARRGGLFGRGPVKRLAAPHGFAGRVRKGRLELTPPSEPAEWVDGLLAALSQDAARDHEIRSTLTRAGWALR